MLMLKISSYKMCKNKEVKVLENKMYLKEKKFKDKIVFNGLFSNVSNLFDWFESTDAIILSYQYKFITWAE